MNRHLVLVASALTGLGLTACGATPMATPSPNQSGTPTSVASARTPPSATPPEPVPVGGCERTLTYYPTLRVGDRGPAVRTLQCFLEDGVAALALGTHAYTVSVDGNFGPATLAAARDQLRDDKVTTIGPREWVALITLPISTLGIGAHGPDVRTLQRALMAGRQGADIRIAVDGVYGTETANMVRDYQRQNGLPVTGRVDAATIDAMHRGITVTFEG